MPMLAPSWHIHRAAHLQVRAVMIWMSTALASPHVRSRRCVGVVRGGPVGLFGPSRLTFDAGPWGNPVTGPWLLPGEEYSSPKQ